MSYAFSSNINSASSIRGSCCYTFNSEPQESLSLMDSYEDWVFDGISEEAADEFASSGNWIDGMSHHEVRNALIKIQCAMDELDYLSAEAEQELAEA